MSGLRTYHAKTRNGCRQCKTRRVKCECVGPICSSCRRRKEACSYQSMLTRVQLTKSPETAAAAAQFEQYWEFQPLPSDSLDFVATLGEPERELMHHFLSNACFTLALGQDPKECKVWPIALPALARRCLFIRHSILAVSAIHLCYLGSPNTLKYSMLACRYHIKASRQFRTSVQEISQDNLGVALAFAASVGIIGLSLPLVVERGALSNELLPPFNPYDMLSILRHTGRLFPMNERSVKVKGAWVALPLPLEPLASPEFSIVKNQTLDSLKILKRRLAEAREIDRNLYAAASADYKAIDALETWINSLSGSPFLWKQFMTWPSTVPSAFMARLQECCLPALEILIYWCTIMKQAPSRWYLQPWFDRTLKFALDTIELHDTADNNTFKANTISGANYP